MPILSAQVGQAGMSGVNPKFIYIDTSDTIATVTATGYLNTLADQGYPLSEKDMALVTTKANTSSPFVPSFYTLSFSAGNWTLTAI